MSLPLRAMLLAAIAAGFVLSASPLMAPGVRAAVPRVVIVVGPVGPVTDRYRADGEEAARAARDAGAAVTTIYSPDATWPKVKAALQGASIVVYMGHGNGFPSRYGPILRKETKDGLGLNPVGGVDDVAHQYFGESYLARGRPARPACGGPAPPPVLRLGQFRAGPSRRRPPDREAARRQHGGRLARRRRRRGPGRRVWSPRPLHSPRPRRQVDDRVDLADRTDGTPSRLRLPEFTDTAA